MSEIARLLLQVRAENNEALAELVEHYMPIIRSNCWYDDPQVNEDCRQFIILNLIIAIKRFKPVINYLEDNNSV